MKKILFIASISLLSLMSFFSCQNFHEELSSENDVTPSTRAVTGTHYYWHNGEKVWLTIDNSKKYVLVSSSEKSSVAATLKKTDATQMFQDVVLSSRIQPSSNIRRESSSNQKNLAWGTVTESDYTTLSRVSAMAIVYDAPYFRNTDGSELGLSHLFYVKLSKADDVELLKALAEKNRVEIVGNNEWMPLWYTLACSNESAGNALEMANLMYESGHFESAQPDLMCEDQLYAVVNDPMYGYQWHLSNTGQSGGLAGMDIKFESARPISRGASNVIVAVVDQGIQLNHPDLNVHSVSYDSQTGTSPSQVYGTHGTNCAGFISAITDNGIGIASIVPDCKVMSVSNNLAGTPDSRQKRADAINFARINGAAVISNSWGSTVQYQIINDAISAALTLGRGGKGCVVVFASGNESQSTVGYPANCNPDILAVGSINRSGARSQFSNYGTALDVVAPGESVVSTTTGSGYTPSSGISGTSFACPIVAGVAALVISINPNLTQKQVATIIEKTAVKNGGYSYSTTSGRPNGTWSSYTGYGLVNAYAAAVEASGGGLGVLYFNNKNVTSNTTVSGTIISSENVVVSNKAKLTMKGTQKIGIVANFTINSDSSLTISH